MCIRDRINGKVRENIKISKDETKENALAKGKEAIEMCIRDRHQ